MLRKRKHVFVRVLEPGNTVACGKGANRVLILRHSRIPFEGNPLRQQTIHCRNDIFHLPSQHGVLRWCEFLQLTHAEHGTVGVEDQREAIVFEEAESELLAIEARRFFGLSGYGERCHFRETR